MDKKKLFLNSTDISQITGLDIRSARRMMQFIRDERGYVKQRIVSIYDFCFVFNLPVNVVYEHVNSDLFVKKQKPFDETSARKEQRRCILEDGAREFLYHKDFDLFMIGNDLKSRPNKFEKVDCTADTDCA